ncbi:MAG: hypothetical protein F9K18_11005, partial [Thermoanaerobaculia bacterium]
MRTRTTLLLMLLAATAAAGDRLPLAGGGWIETRGPWRLAGRQVIFRTAEGRLAALPATAVGQASIDTTAFGALTWRNIGPQRGGRSVAAAGST